VEFYTRGNYSNKQISILPTAKEICDLLNRMYLIQITSGYIRVKTIPAKIMSHRRVAVRRHRTAKSEFMLVLLT
jgi:hypothetical protein